MKSNKLFIVGLVLVALAALMVACQSAPAATTEATPCPEAAPCPTCPEAAPCPTAAPCPDCPKSVVENVPYADKWVASGHNDVASEAFENAIAAMPEVVDCFSVSGDADYMLRIVVPDLAVFSQLMMKRLLCLPGVARIKTSIALQTVKQTHVLPLDHLTQPSKPRQRVRYAES